MSPSEAGESALLAPHTTLGVGGSAAALVRASHQEQLLEAVREADQQGAPLLVLGGGSNLVVSDEGFPGVALSVETRGITYERISQDRVLLTAEAGEPWDEVVEQSVERGLTGLEALSGIPGRVGATPIQNVGAYGVEVSDRLVEVVAWDRREAREVVIPAGRCGFGYRQSRFKGRDRFLVLRVGFRLSTGQPEPLRHPELAAMAPRGVAQVRMAVLRLRREKGMVWDPDDPDCRSAGSFFLNPVVSEEACQRILQAARREGLLASEEDLPRYSAPGGGVKLAAAWLIERAGFPRGTSRGRVGLSRRHALALVNLGGASAGDVLALAREVRDAVLHRFGVGLRPEPVFVGFPEHPLEAVVQVPPLQ